MKKFIKYNDIVQFRNICKTINDTSKYIGQDENDEPVFDYNIKNPVINAIGSEKIHGSCGSICYNNGDFWIQSRNNIITIEKDNSGCALAAEKNKAVWIDIIHQLAVSYNIDTNKNIISVFYEWCGGNIQRKSAISGLDKRAIIFQHFKVSPINQIDDNSYWLETKVGSEWISSNDNNIFNVMNFPTYEIEIDFENPLLYQNKMIEMVLELEKNSPIGEEMGKKGNVGEGIVFTFEYKDTIFKWKTKGEEHSKGSGKKKTLKPVDNNYEQKKIDFVNNIACTESRLEQTYNETFDTINGGKGDIKKTGDYLRNVIKDVIKEESDILIELEISPKDINRKISNIARPYMLSRLDKEMMGEK